MKKVAYIESGSGQYVNTGYIAKSTTKVVMKCNLKEQGAFPTPFGTRKAPNSQAYVVFSRFGSNSNMRVCFSQQELSAGSSSSIFEKDITITFYSGKLEVVDSDGNTLIDYSFSQTGTPTTTYPLYLFTLDEAGRDYGQLTWQNMKLMSCDIYEENNLVMSLLPYIDDEEVPCLKDELTDQVFYSASSTNFIAGEIVFRKYYLVKSEEKYYTIEGGALTKLADITALSSDVFLSYGSLEVPTSDILLTLTNPTIYCWTNDEELPTLTATVTATPYPQNVTSKRIDLSHESITGIENMIAECEGELICAVSFDDKQTWKAWNGEVWATLTEDFTGMSKETLESITFEQWNELYSGADSLYIRISLVDTTQSVTEIVVDFSN